MKKVLVTPRSFGKNDPTLFDQLKAGGFEVVRNDTGAILSEETICRMIAQRIALDACTDYKPFVKRMIRIALDKLATI